MSRTHRCYLLAACVSAIVLTCVFTSSSPAQSGDRPSGRGDRPDRPVVHESERERARDARLERAHRELREREEHLRRRAEELEGHERELGRREQDLRIRELELEVQGQRMELERGELQPLRRLFALVGDVTEIADDPVASAVLATITLEEHVDGPAQAAEILADMLPDVRNATVERVVRLRLLDLCARAGQPDAALCHLRELIVGVEPDDEDDEDDDDD